MARLGFTRQTVRLQPFERPRTLGETLGSGLLLSETAHRARRWDRGWGRAFHFPGIRSKSHLGQLLLAA